MVDSARIWRLEFARIILLQERRWGDTPVLHLLVPAAIREAAARLWAGLASALAARGCGGGAIRPGEPGDDDEDADAEERDGLLGEDAGPAKGGPPSEGPPSSSHPPPLPAPLPQASKLEDVGGRQKAAAGRPGSTSPIIRGAVLRTAALAALAVSRPPPVPAPYEQRYHAIQVVDADFGEAAERAEWRRQAEAAGPARQQPEEGWQRGDRGGAGEASAPPELTPSAWVCAVCAPGRCALEEEEEAKSCYSPVVPMGDPGPGARAAPEPAAGVAVAVSGSPPAQALGPEREAPTLECGD